MPETPPARPSRGDYWARANPVNPEFEVDKWPFYRLARLVGLYNQRMDTILKPIGVDVPRWRVLMILSQAKVATITKLSDEAVVKISTMAKIIQRMAAQGLVTTRISQADARTTEVQLTRAGRAMLEQVRVKVGFVFDQAFHGVSEKELEKLNALCMRLHDNLA